MIQLTQEQVAALNASEQPPVAGDPQTGQEYLLIRREVYELVRGTLKPYGRGWDDPDDDDLIRKDTAKRRPRAIGSRAALIAANEYCLRHYAIGYTGGIPRRLTLPVGPIWVVPIVLTSAGYGIVGDVGIVAVDAFTRKVVGATSRAEVLASGVRLVKEKRGELDAAFHRARPIVR